jgi:deoxyribose-phosphate aldolase
MKRHELAGRLVQLIVRPEVLPPQVHREVTEAMQNGLAAVLVAPVWVSRVATMLQASGVTVGAVVGFPHGTNKSTLKAIEATSSIKDGAEWVQVVPHLPNLLRQDLDAAKFELLEIVRAARSTRREVMIHVIIETALLLREADATEAAARIATACRAVRESGCDGIATSTGFHPAGDADLQAVGLLKQHGEGLITLASGRIRQAEQAAGLLAAGSHLLCCEHASELLADCDAGSSPGPRSER